MDNLEILDWCLSDSTVEIQHIWLRFCEKQYRMYYILYKNLVTGNTKSNSKIRITNYMINSNDNIARLQTFSIIIKSTLLTLMPTFGHYHNLQCLTGKVTFYHNLQCLTGKVTFYHNLQCLTGKVTFYHNLQCLTGKVTFYHNLQCLTGKVTFYHNLQCLTGKVILILSVMTITPCTAAMSLWYSQQILWQTFVCTLELIAETMKW